MTPDEVGGRLSALVEGASHTVSFDQVHVDVPAASWVEAASVARDAPELELTYFDWLSAVDELESFSVVTHLWSVRHRHHVLLRTSLPHLAPRLDSLVDVFAGAAWHERETFEMFGIVFDGHPELIPLLLPDGFDGHPLRKDFVLASRVAKPWPGAKDPGESGEGAPSRRRVRPPGVPEQWGPDGA